MEIERVKKYVLSSLIAIVLFGHSLAVAALGAVSRNVGGSREGLFVLSVMFAAVAIGAVRLINRLKVLTPWLSCAVLPATLFYVLWFAILGN